MIVKVFIKRKFQEGKESDVLQLLKQMRAKAMDYDGYISGETLISTTNPMEVMVISNWENLDCWAEWRNSQSRASIDSKLERLQDKPTEYEPFVYSKYWLAIKEEGWEKRKEGTW
ncbi:MAG: antibiotic biosynthesis monooxygenase [Desulfobacterales bacterium]|jgi:heme-degrading monooxygenase HmoA